MLLISFGLALLTAAVFWQICGFEFVSYDDASYIPDNPQVRDGLSRDGIVWAFTTRYHGYWHPVTWIAHMTVCQFFGLNAGAHHAVNLLVHAANVFLLFGLLIRLTSATGRSAFVAALFAIHPLHVESVAWIAELKDLLSTMFWLLTVGAYTLYVQRERRGIYWLAVATYTIGLMAKPMIVTLPVMLLLLDYWPLERVLPGNRETGVSLRRLIMEKMPFFVLAAISCAITYLTTLFSGVMGSSAIYPLPIRLTNVVVSYAAYLWKMFWPDRMACFYPFQVPEPWKIAVATIFLAAVSIFVLRYWRQYRFLATGWLWYLVALLPVIGFIQAGSQSMADRYSYVSLIGIFIMISWGAPALADHFHGSPSQRQRMAQALLVPAVLIIVLLSARAWFQTRTWRDPLTLSQHAVRVTSDNFRQFNNLGILLADQGRYDEAISNYFESIKINPDFAWARNNLGNALMLQGRLHAAIREFRKALQLNPDYAEAQNNMGIAMAKQGKLDEAISCFMASLKANPDKAERQKNLLLAIGKLSDREKAIAHCREALTIAQEANEPEMADVIRERLDLLEAP